MKFHLSVSRVPRGGWNVYRCTSLLAITIACAALFFASQASAQSRFDSDSIEHVAKPAQEAVSAMPQTSAVVTIPADTDVLIAVPEAPVPEAAVPGAPISSFEEASLVSPTADMFLSLAQENGQSSSSQTLPSGGAPAQPRAVKTKSPHHGLGVALAIVGSAALVVGVAAYAISGIDICANAKSGGCKETRDAGLVLMPVGGGVAFTGFYLVFHH